METYKFEDAKVSTTFLEIDITGQTPEQIIQQLRKTIDFFEEVRYGRATFISIPFPDDDNVAVRVRGFDGDTWSIRLKYEDFTRYKFDAPLSTAELLINGERFVSVHGTALCWIQSDGPVENYIALEAEGILRRLPDMKDGEEE